MLACAAGIPALAMSGVSWPDVLKKFQDFRWQTILTPASASSAVAQSEAPRFPSPPAKALPVASDDAIASGRLCAANLPLQGSSGACRSPASPTDGLSDIENRLRELGATYYRLESWGNDQQLYRFYCKVAVAGSADYAHCFEAVHADPRQAMLQVLREVEGARGNEGGRRRAEGGERSG
jgi:hypothetical protein